MGNISKLIITRLALGIFVLWVVSLFIFLGVSLLPGDVATEILGQSALPETVAAFRHELGLDLPLHIRYVHWLGGLLTGDLGHSLANGRAVSQLIGERLGNTLFLAGVAACFSVPVSLLLGLLTALYRGSVFDRLANAVTLTWISFPEFFVAYILIMFFSVQAGWFPSLSTIRDSDSFTHSLYLVTLPAMTLTLVVAAHMMRMTRAAIISVLGSPFIEMAKLKGIGQRRVIVWHALPNALAPIINVVVIDLAYLIVGVVVVEVVFVYPGLGQLMIDSVQRRDITVVQACSLIFAATYILLNMFADVLAIATNPRLMYPK
ncbi:MULTISPECIES: ABC transporter permease [unclassified Mesorhizobium]|uniref:ABC transporter permease n=1 Tax=unclassified Mesorhizobium TaxID=325217 RepID=UPI0003CF34D9|nr:MULTISPECIES: ABC transporter permease [unclassified Mesorhizobium]ESY10744.1 ABC transporter permease [Mesorhizobium sp. LNJC395A00]WJI74778.1 ABC transporter permease [Mesorhizobium sp. C395A]